MQRIDGVEHHAGGSGARQRGRDLAADVPGFPDPDDHHFASFAQGFDDGLDGDVEGLVELASDRPQGGGFDGEDLACALPVLHRERTLP